MFLHLAFLLFSPHLSLALPLPRSFGLRRSTITSLISPEQANAAFLRPALFARASYCSSDSVADFGCGPQCDALGGGIEVLLAGGDDGLIPNFFIVHDSQTQSIVVAHQGTEKENILSVLNNVKVDLTDLNPERVPNRPDGVQVHDGFQDVFERTADQILSTVQKGLAEKQVNKVLVTGHSLGGAVAILDSLMLKANLNPDVQITTTVFGIPRVGNTEFASFVKSTLGSSFSYVTNGKDPVPTVPPRFLGYVHPEGEFHINTPGLQVGDIEEIVACEGAENESCSAGTSLFEWQVSDHNGPYIDGIGFGGRNCPA